MERAKARNSKTVELSSWKPESPQPINGFQSTLKQKRERTEAFGKTAKIAAGVESCPLEERHCWLGEQNQSRWVWRSLGGVGVSDPVRCTAEQKARAPLQKPKKSVQNRTCWNHSLQRKRMATRESGAEYFFLRLNT